jgi:phosphoinositide-3-kinase regulatory subunit 4
VVVRVFLQRALTAEPIITTIKQTLESYGNVFSRTEHPNVLPYSVVIDHPKASFLLRPYLFATLADRIAMRPALSFAEKLWIMYQSLSASHQTHSAGFIHGDLKAENVVLTSWGWVFATDFAPFKPSVIPADTPAAFSLFFDTSKRRTCYLAPERFGSQTLFDPPTVQMDVFAMGCVMAQLFLDGKPLMDLSTNLRFRRGEFDPACCSRWYSQRPGLCAHCVHAGERQRGTTLCSVPAREVHKRRPVSALFPRSAREIPLSYYLDNGNVSDSSG